MAIYYKDFHLLPPLHEAAARNQCGIVKSLLKKIDVDTKARENSTALHLGSMYGHLKVVKLLLQNKADVNAKKDGGFTPLHLAIQQSHFEVSEFLIENGANINAIDDQNWIPLHNAAYNGFSLKIVQSLIAKGAGTNAKIDDGRGALHLAAENDHLEIVNFLIENGADVNSINGKGWTPLHSAAYDGNIRVVKVLLDQVVDINAKTVKSTTPLHFAVDHDHLDVVELLLERGADVNALDHTNWTALHFAADKGYNHIVTVLLKYGADISMKEESGGTALHRATHFPEVLETLIINGADVNAKTDRNFTPLHLAVQIGNLDVVKTLLMKGAWFDARADGDQFVLPLHFAEKMMHRRQNLDVIKLLKCIEKLFKAVQYNNYLEVENCIKEGLIIDSKNTDGRTPLHYAVNNGHVDIVNILLTNGADATKVTNKGNTPLHTAVSQGYANIVEILLQHVNHDKLRDFIDAQTTAEGNTSLHVATKNGFFDIVKSLLMCGAIYNIKNKNGKTPFDLSENQNIINLLKLVEELFEDAKNYNLETTYKILESVSLLEKLNELQVCLESDTSNQDVKGKVILNPDSVIKIAEYLSNYDLINFILVFYNSKKH